MELGPSTWMERKEDEEEEEEADGGSKGSDMTGAVKLNSGSGIACHKSKHGDDTVR